LHFGAGGVKEEQVGDGQAYFQGEKGCYGQQGAVEVPMSGEGQIVKRAQAQKEEDAED